MAIGESLTMRLRMRPDPPDKSVFGLELDEVLTQRKTEADDFFATVAHEGLDSYRDRDFLIRRFTKLLLSFSRPSASTSTATPAKASARCTGRAGPLWSPTCSTRVCSWTATPRLGLTPTSGRGVRKPRRPSRRRRGP